MVSRQRRRPFAEHPDKIFILEVRPNLIQWKIGKTKPVKRRFENQIDGVENQRPIHTDANLSSIVMKKPPSI